MDEQLTENIKDKNNWQRLLFMLLFGVFYSITEIVLLIVIVFQFLARLTTASTNARALSFGAQLSTYIYQIFMYLTYNSEERPYPFANWPTANIRADLPSHTRRGRPRKKAPAAAKAEAEKKPRSSKKVTGSK